MATIKQRLNTLETRLAPAEAWPELVILHEGESMTPHQQSECERAKKFNLPHLTIILGAARHGE